MKKYIFLAIACAFYAKPSIAQQTNPSPRVNKLFNFDWKFKAGSVTGAQNVSYNDSGWQKLDLPHDFQINQPWDQSASASRGFKAMGEGWYRKTFKADPGWKGRIVKLDFEGIMVYGDVWLNGKKIGGTDYGYLGFESDITSLLKWDAENVVTVYSTTGTTGGSRWYTGGGLFRDVHVLVTDSVSIARHGVFITTPEITSDRASVKVQVEVEGNRRKRASVQIVTKIYAPDGKLVAETKNNTPAVSKRQTDEVPLPEVRIAAPQVWSCENPALYSAVVSLYQNGKEIDRVTEKFGVRTIEFSKEFGFKLNGKKVFLKGIANHSDLGAVGTAAFETAIARQMDLLKSFGYNHIRTSHNPYSEAFLRLADEKGILIVDELYDKWSNKDYWVGREPWTNTWYKNLPEWIKRDRNHPSVILWSLGNELQMREDLSGYPTGDFGVTTYRLMDVLVKRYDPTRKTTVAMFPARAGGIGKSDPGFNTNIVPPELATVTDVSSFNYRWFNYADYLKHAPDMNIYQSEATTNELLSPFFGMNRDKMVGLAYWGAIEYWGESNGWPKKGWNFSYFTHALEPLPQAYLIQSAFEDKPLVHIAVQDSVDEKLEWNDISVGGRSISSHWNRVAGKKYNVFTYSNAYQVELWVNGKLLGVQENSQEIAKRNIQLWKDVTYAAGNIQAVAKDKDGKEVARYVVETTGKAVALKLVPENNKWKADGMDLQYVKVYAVDSKGRQVPDFDGEVVFDVSGTAQIIAVDNGNHLSNEVFLGNKKQMFKGFAMAILRSKQTAGTVNVSVKANGLKTSSKKLITQ
ncbi:glycoside hydrolase family 2 TIM barrel-domain containing protein [Pedobacter sp. MW01-1-1]|uniref:glycoside hydrolase family 2 TIM barrel-domain containing protein n=1 Tax=Pedobacter sp. MW01-1-1 TaxID=3383027 RepID=UPI003FED9E6D